MGKNLEQEGSSHGGFKTTNCRAYDILFEISKLLSYSHGDQKSGKANRQAYFFLIGIHSMQGWTATTRHSYKKKKAQKQLQATENLFRKNL